MRVSPTAFPRLWSTIPEMRNSALAEAGSQDGGSAGGGSKSPLLTFANVGHRISELDVESVVSGGEAQLW
jgi:hypothetical protein